MKPPRSGFVARSGFVEGPPSLHYLAWEGSGADSLLLVHGNSANAWWWVPVAEALREFRARIVAVDLRGHGDSEWMRPPAYSPQAYGADLARLIEQLGLVRPVVAGHSMGGIAALAMATGFPNVARAIIAIDVPVTSTPRRNRYLRHLKALPAVVYPDRATAIAKFRLMPNEGEIAPAILRSVAEHSMERTSTGGYTMKFDRESFFGSDGLDVAAALRALTLPTLLVRAGLSRILTPEAAAAAAESNPLVRLVAIPNAHHHLPLERPIELATAMLEFAQAIASAASESA